MLGLFYFYTMNIEALYSLYKNQKTVCTDTRKIKKGAIYFALKGDNFDGNKFADKAIEAGASFCVIDDANLSNDSNKFILVNDVLETLQKLANYHRKQLKYPIIGLTGSNGKTTTKELINRVLSTTYRVSATEGNLNNHIGVPLTLLSFSKDLDFGIVEMGANHQKEIEFLCKIAEPDYGLITNFGKAHLEGFGGVKGVIKGKSELYDYLKSNSKTAFINTDDPKQVRQIGNYSKIITFGSSDDNNCIIKFKAANPFVNFYYGNALIHSKLIGDYNFGNIAIAVAIGQHFNIPVINIKEGVETYEPDNNRSEIIETKSNKIILDAYNANPTSMLATLRNFKNFDAEDKYLFLGDMFELGEAADTEHQAIVDYAESNFDNPIFLVGENFYKTQTKASAVKYSTFESFKKEFHNLKIKNATILIKGSRGMALERILDLL